MPSAWRIVKRRHVDHAFDGEGARRFGGRWNSPGTAVVYLAESRALAALEILAGLGSVAATSAWVLVEARFDASLVETLDPDELPDRWRESPPTSATQAVGDRWVREGRSVLLRVASVLVPEESDFVLNPAHPDATEVEVREPTPFRLDPRLRG